MRLLSSLLATLALTAASAQSTTPNTAVLTNLAPSSLTASGQGATVTPSGGVLAGQGSVLPTSAGSSQTDGIPAGWQSGGQGGGNSDMNDVFVNTLDINTQDMCLFQRMKQHELQFAVAKREFDQFTNTFGNGGASADGSTPAAADQSPIVTTLGAGFWQFSTSPQAAPQVSTAAATEAAADTYIPSFMQNFWGNYSQENYGNTTQILSVNNVHVFNFNIQPLVEWDMQFQAQPQAQIDLNGLVFQFAQYCEAGDQSCIEAATQAAVSAYGSTQQNNGGYNNGYGNQQNQPDYWNQDDQQDQQNYQNFQNWYGEQNDFYWPYDNNVGNTLVEFIQHAGNVITVDTLSINKQRKYVTQCMAQFQEQGMFQEFDFDIEAGFPGASPNTAVGTSGATATTDPNTGINTSTQGSSAPTNTGSTQGSTAANNWGGSQPTVQQTSGTATFSALQFNFNTISVRNKNIQPALIVAAQVQLEAQAQAQINGPLIFSSY